MYKRNKTLEGEIEELNRKVDEQAKTIVEQKEAASAAASSSGKSKDSSGNKVKKSSSVRAKLFHRMSLHSESQC